MSDLFESYEIEIDENPKFMTKEEWQELFDKQKEALREPRLILVPYYLWSHLIGEAS